MTADVHVEYCDEWHVVSPDQRFSIGRTGDLTIDDNPYLHRTFLELSNERGVWVIANVGRALAATVSDLDNRFVAHLAPGGVLPLVFGRSRVRFGAGPTTYELTLVLSAAPFQPIDASDCIDDELAATTRGTVLLSPDQKRLVVALAETELRRTGTGPATLPTTAEAARKLGWSEKKFHKKLDGVCQRLARAGIPGLHGSPGDLASNRRARLVEYCLSTAMVTVDDLTLLE